MPDPDRDTKFWTLFLKIHIISNVAFHTISVWLTVYLSFFRYFYLRSLIPSINPSKLGVLLKMSRIGQSIQACTLKYNRTLVSISLIYVLGIIFSLPVYFYSSLKENYFIYNETDNSTSHVFSNGSQIMEKYYSLEPSELNLITHDFIFNLMLYSQIIFEKLIPCLIILFFTLLISKKLLLIKLHKNRLFPRNNIRIKKNSLTMLFQRVLRHKKSNPEMNEEVFDFDSYKPRDSKRRQLIQTANNQSRNSILLMENLDQIIIRKDSNLLDEKIIDHEVLKKKIFNKLKLGKNIHNRTTIMLVIVCFLFLIVELPITLLSLLAMSLDENIYIDIYIPLVEFMDLSVLIYSSINLVLYCSMSSVFRKELVRIFSDVLYRLILVYNLIIRLFQNYDFY